MNDKDTLFKVLNNINGWTMNCDTKASVILGGYGVSFSLIFVTDVINKIIKVIKDSFKDISLLKIGYLLLFFVAIIFLILGLIFVISVLVPRIENNCPSLMFFSLISKRKTLESYKTAVADYDEKEVKNDLLNQIYAAAKICTKKFKYQKYGVIFSSIGWYATFTWIAIGYAFFN